MDSTLAQWLAYAPKPHPLAAGQKWHVFISYRSTSRPWVLQLYDVLRHLGFDVFVDQYVLSAAAPLALSLSDGLEQSAAAVLVWSSAFEDSDWCKAEYGALETREKAGEGFRFVIAKLDGAKLPALAAGKLFVDFAQDRDAPRGTNLLTLLWGLEGKALPPEAVQLAAMVDDQSRTARAQVRAAREAGDAARLVELSRTPDLAWQTSSALGSDAADALIALDRIDDALAVLASLSDAFPRAVRPRLLRGLALARRGDLLAAQQVFGELYAAGEVGPETLGMYARTWMDRYRATGNRLFLLKSRDLYREAFETWPGDHYTGINAAAKSLLLGERDVAMELAQRVDQLLAGMRRPPDYWRLATAAESRLLQGDCKGAAALYVKAVSMAPEELGSHRVTRDQAVALLDVQLIPQPDRQAVLAAFAHLAR